MYNDFEEDLHDFCGSLYMRDWAHEYSYRTY